MKKGNHLKKSDVERLEKAMFDNPVVSNSDCTGFMQTLPYCRRESENLSDLLNVTTSVVSKKKNEKDSFEKNSGGKHK